MGLCVWGLGSFGAGALVAMRVFVSACGHHRDPQAPCSQSGISEKTAHLFLDFLFQTTKADGLAGTGEKLRLKPRFSVLVPLYGTQNPKINVERGRKICTAQKLKNLVGAGLTLGLAQCRPRPNRPAKSGLLAHLGRQTCRTGPI